MQSPLVVIILGGGYMAFVLMVIFVVTCISVVVMAIQSVGGCNNFYKAAINDIRKYFKNN